MTPSAPLPGPVMTPFRIDVDVHDLLMEKRGLSALHPEAGLKLPDPVYPQDTVVGNGDAEQYQKRNAVRAATAWAFPFFKSLWHRGELRPITAYLFSETSAISAVTTAGRTTTRYKA